MRRPLAGLALAALAAAAAPALAAEPESGAVSIAAPSVQWDGTSTAGFVTTFAQIFVNAAGQEQPCQAPSCDTFTLEVKDSADLDVAVTSDATITYLQIEKPDGSVVYNNGIEPEGSEADPVTKLRIKKAPVGTYKVQAAVNSPVDEVYQGSATLLVPKPPAPAQPGQPAPGAPPAQPAQPGAGAPATIGARTGRLSARRLARTRKLPLTLTASKPVTGVRIVLASRGKAVATGTLARLEGTKRHSLRLRRKLKPGRYQLAVEGRDAGGGTAGVKVTLRVGR